MPFIATDDSAQLPCSDDGFVKHVRAPAAAKPAKDIFAIESPATAASSTAGRAHSFSTSTTAKQLQAVVLDRDLATLRRLLDDALVPLTTFGGTGSTGMHLAAELGWEDGVKAFFFAGVDPNVADADGLSPLHYAVVSGDARAIPTLLRCGANVNAQDAVGDTALHYAVRDAKIDIVRFLLATRANPRLANADGETPHRLAADLREDAICQLLKDMSSANCNRNRARPSPRTSPPFFAFV